jgi:serine phosphatase RsbU (regulator of sigma subunit)/Tfp pilus assembly protein PilF
MLTKVISAFQSKLENEKNPKAQIVLMIDFVEDYLDSSLDYCVELALFIQTVARSIQDEDSEKIGELLEAYLHGHNNIEGNMWESIEKALEIRSTFENSELLARTDGYLAFLYWYKGEYDSAFNVALDALALSNQNNFIKAKAWLHYTLGVFYFDLKDFSNASLHFEVAYESFSKLGHTYGMARSQTGLAAILVQENKLEPAVFLLEKNKVIYQELEHYPGLSRTLHDLGLVFHQQKQPNLAQTYFQEALELREKVKHYQGLISTLTELADILLQGNEPEKAFVHLEKAFHYAKLLNALPKLYRIHWLFHLYFKKVDEPWKSLEHLEAYDQIKSKVVGEQTTNKLNQLQAKFEKEHSEKEAEINRLKNVELVRAYNSIEEKNKEIMDSIHYAKYLQDALLPDSASFKEVFAESFVFFRPKDIVAGDFYWILQESAELTEEQGKQVYFAVADCTGHGVPGAMVSVVCSNALNTAVKDFGVSEPGMILDKVNELVLSTFKSSLGIIKDGMDIGLGKLNLSTRELEWAGANIPMWIRTVRNGKISWIEFIPDKSPIGSAFVRSNYKTQKVNLEAEDLVFMFSDGFQDQFGGLFNKKFKKDRLLNLLKSISDQDMETQGQFVENAFEHWKGFLEQIDDVCVVGLKIP